MSSLHPPSLLPIFPTFFHPLHSLEKVVSTSNVEPREYDRRIAKTLKFLDKKTKELNNQNFEMKGSGDNCIETLVVLHEISYVSDSEFFSSISPFLR